MTQQIFDIPATSWKELRGPQRPPAPSFHDSKMRLGGSAPATGILSSAKRLRLLAVVLTVLTFLLQLGKCAYFLYFLKEVERYRHFVLIFSIVTNGVGIVIAILGVLFICFPKIWRRVWLTLGGSMAIYQSLMLGIDVCEMLFIINICYIDCAVNETWPSILYLVISCLRISHLFILWRLYRIQKKA
uniref:G_PROTEIN_RECEP_F1_2 domain-containing protein n=1 Tax=Steinernema glaseri TaxID=37863 RepID=A0A1I7ZAW2_9BILA